MTKHPKPSGHTSGIDEADYLASQYAMGLLEGEERLIIQARIKSDAEFEQLVADWQARLAPMLEDVDQVEPAPESWLQLEQRLFGEKTQQSEIKTSFWSNLGFWRGLTFASVLITLLSLGTSNLIPGFFPRNDNSDKVYLAALNLAKDKPTYIMQFDKSTGILNLSGAKFPEDETRVGELWLIGSDGVPVSLGLLESKGKTKLTLAQPLIEQFETGVTLAVSLEPSTGAPEGKPTGPIIALGTLEKI